MTLRLGFAVISGDPPDPAYRVAVLRDSLAALHRSRRTRMRYLRAGCGMAAAFIAGIAFLLGRYSVPQPPAPAPAVVAEAAKEVTVPDDLIAWVEAADLFRRLGMEDRMARAVSKASNRLPREAFDDHTTTRTPGTVVTAGQGSVVEQQTPEAFSILARVLASTGSYQEMTTPSLGACRSIQAKTL